jgi:hypothetical protein
MQSVWVGHHLIIARVLSLKHAAPPFETDPSPTYKITKVAMGSGEYTIEFTGECDSIFACTPTLPAAQADFTQSILAAEPASHPKKKKKGAYQTTQGDANPFHAALPRSASASTDQDRDMGAIQSQRSY